MVTEARWAHNTASSRRCFWLVLGAVLCSTSSCSIDSKHNTLNVTDASSIGHLPAPPIAATPGSPTPSPAAPAPTPAPAPQPSPSAAPQGSCKLPPGSGNGQNCTQGNPSFLNDVEASIDQLVKSHPELFDTSLRKCDDCYKVLDTRSFTDLMVQTLEQRGLCATFDGEEFGVKNTNDFNDQYDVLTFDDYLRRGDGAYRSTCRPAAF